MRNMKTRCVILDLDGLIVDSEPLHQRAFNAFLARRGIPYQFDDEEYGRLFVGVPVAHNAQYLIERFGLEQSAAQVLAEREAIFEELIGDSANLVAMPGLWELVETIEAKGIALGVASGSPRDQVETMLSGLRLAPRLKAIVAGTDVARTKPAPDVYLRAVEQLGVSKDHCVAVEDSATGIASAKAAGLRVIAVPNRYTRLQELAADVEVASLNEVIALI